MGAIPSGAVGAIGLLVGVLIGFAVWRGRLCAFGAVEDGLMGRDWRRMKAFALALGLAILGTQALAAAGLFDPALSTYAPARLALLPIGLGAVMFGFGMAMVGTCGFGSLVRAGGGDLRALVTLLIFGAAAYAMQRGALAPLRIALMEKVAAPVPFGEVSAVPPALAFLGFGAAGAALAFLVAVALVWWALADARVRRSRRMLLAGASLGFGVVAGWLATQVLVDPFDPLVRTQSLTFVAPVGRAIFGVLLNAAEWSDFGVGTVPGVVLGAFWAAWRSDEFRWSAFDDAFEMRRHLGGAALMGVGGVLAGGCTIGQGLTAGSLMAYTWPITVAGMMLGARLGIARLVGEGWRDLLPSRRD